MILVGLYWKLLFFPALLNTYSSRQIFSMLQIHDKNEVIQRLCPLDIPWALRLSSNFWWNLALNYFQEGLFHLVLFLILTMHSRLMFLFTTTSLNSVLKFSSRLLDCFTNISYIALNNQEFDGSFLQDSFQQHRSSDTVKPKL